MNAEPSSRLRRALAAVARSASWLGPGALLAWLLALAMSVVQARVWPEPLPALFAAGLLALAAGVLALLASLLLACLPARWLPAPPAATSAIAALRALAIAALTTALCAPLLRALLRPFVPKQFAYQDDIAYVLALYLAVGLGAACAWLAFGGGGAPFARERRGAFPPWVLVPVYVVASALAAEPYDRFAPGRELWPLLLLLAFATLALAGLARRLLGAVSLPALAGLAVLSAVATLALLSGQRQARAQLVERYPGPASLLVPLHAWFDLDGDGAAALLAGGDCDDTRFEVAPNAIEIVGNGVDDNCIGGDLRSADPEVPLRRTPGRARNVVVVTVDTVRADRLDQSHMPQLQRIARAGAQFSQAYAAASYTTASMYAIMTGQLPMSSALAWGQDLGAESSLAELLHEAGYRTQLIFHRWQHKGVRWRGEAGFGKVTDIAAGQDAYRLVLGPEVTAQALAALRELQSSAQPFLLWVHYVDPHAEQVPRANTPFSGRDDGAGRYDQEVFATDRELGVLNDALERSGFFTNGLLIVHSDHGEQLGEHGRWGHALWLSPEVMHAVLVLRGADVPAARIATRVRLVDIYPTVLELAAGITGPAAGRSLAPLWLGSERADRDVFAYTIYPGAWQRAAMVDSWALREDLLHGADYLYDLARDPQQRVNLIEREPQRAAQLEHVLGDTWDRSMNNRVIEHHGRIYLRNLCALGQRDACLALQRAAKSTASIASPAR